MERSFHPLPELFAQLGLPETTADIDAFVQSYGPLASDVALADATFWSATQSTFLRESLADDADWAEAVDHLDALLR
ncbi:MAG: DUF2789 family protein [Halothiobacillus sp.]|jgi:hypothetical protein|uniref:DUF2789 family protein n=1 Tax=Halothiobacillus sp. TaxID=1891311 RepID=UPI002AD3EBDE|nr:DUF2789 family protein [Halothiobacillus sp.]MDA3877415.1 DUF2789 family protein [Halothiobacillus sp.]